MMVLAVVLVKTLNNGKIRIREAQVRRSIKKQRKRIGGLFIRPNIKQKGKDVDTIRAICRAFFWGGDSVI